jgi:hypothetical protein
MKNTNREREGRDKNSKNQVPTSTSAKAVYTFACGKVPTLRFGLRQTNTNI